MWGFLGSLLTGGAGLLGSVFSSKQSGENTQAQIQASQQQQATQNAFTEQMSSTAYQRASKDMQAAGLNPAMMFGSGSAASTPSGSSIQAPMPQTTSALAGVGDAASKAVSSAVQFKTMDKMADEMANLEAENYRIREQTKNITASTATEKAREVLVRQSANETKEDVERKRRDVPRQEWDAIKHLDLSNIPDAARKSGNIGSWGGEKLADTISPLLNGARSVQRLMPRVQEKSRSYAPDGKSFDEFWKNRAGF